MKKLLAKVKSRFFCLIGNHRFYVWEGKSDLSDKSHPVVYFERTCSVCRFIERRDF